MFFFFFFFGLLTFWSHFRNGMTFEYLKSCYTTLKTWLAGLHMMLLLLLFLWNLGKCLGTRNWVSVLQRFSSLPPFLCTLSIYRRIEIFMKYYSLSLSPSLSHASLFPSLCLAAIAASFFLIFKQLFSHSFQFVRHAAICLT